MVFTVFAVGGVANAINIIEGLNGPAKNMVLWAVAGIAVQVATCLIIAA